MGQTVFWINCSSGCYLWWCSRGLYRPPFWSH